ncbi:AraC family transcriptional regulator [Hyalangium rubrum]|uniref:Helix-turn-helix domain-containing protein n=1 Tax=Hyalangium rubrum TaxID=3103134 RepID=A0ABU5H0M7_9BACT|nr:helix-turn-helix domain-containing protein [Hyalangium sp. s54d21]MDY7225655.1 helix-turn-helix domain-containing protein [Hyalangium sp. s54d21]
MERLNESRIGAVLKEAYAVRAATSMVSTPHAQHGVGLLVGLDSDVTVVEPGRAPVRGRVLVVPPQLWHSASCPGPSLGFLYDPQAAPRLADYSRAPGGAFPLEGRLAARLGAAMASHRASLSHPEVLDGLSREAEGWLGKDSSHRELDRRVARVLEALRDPSVDRRLVLAHSGISQAHLQALFVRDVGLPIRTFLLWRRLLVALAAFSRLDATSAAHLAGFADLAHFSRTCRRMLGYSPTTLRGKLLPA